MLSKRERERQGERVGEGEKEEQEEKKKKKRLETERERGRETERMCCRGTGTGDFEGKAVRMDAGYGSGWPAVWRGLRDSLRSGHSQKAASRSFATLPVKDPVQRAARARWGADVRKVHLLRGDDGTLDRDIKHF